MTRDSKRQVLIRALGIVGERDLLASRLGSTRRDLDAWLDGSRELPDELYLAATNLCLDHEAPSLWDEPRPGGPAKPL